MIPEGLRRELSWTRFSSTLHHTGVYGKCRIYLLYSISCMGRICDTSVIHNFCLELRRRILMAQQSSTASETDQPFCSICNSTGLKLNSRRLEISMFSLRNVLREDLSIARI